MYLSVQLFHNIPECKEKVSFQYWKTRQRRMFWGGRADLGFASHRGRLESRARRLTGYSGISGWNAFCNAL